MITVFIRSLEFYGYHGVPIEERAVGHRYTVDLDLKVDADASQTDDVNDTVDYARVADCILQTSQQNPCKTLERLVQIVAEALFSEFPRVEQVELKIAKRLPPAPVIAEQMGVSATLCRSDFS